MRVVIAVVLGALAVSCTSPGRVEGDRSAVLETLNSWNRGWAEADASTAVEDYSEDADWTNAFGDRFQGRAALRVVHPPFCYSPLPQMNHAWVKPRGVAPQGLGRGA